MRTLSLRRVAPLLFAAACGLGDTPTRVPPGGAAKNVALIYQSRVDGEIEPCG